MSCSWLLIFLSDKQIYIIETKFIIFPTRLILFDLIFLTNKSAIF